MRALNGIGHEIGYFLARQRGQLVAPVLTPREVQVLQLAARALSATAIAAEMQVSPATVKRHFEDAYARLGVSDRAGRGRGRHATRVDHLETTNRSAHLPRAAGVDNRGVTTNGSQLAQKSCGLNGLHVGPVAPSDALALTRGGMRQVLTS